MKTKLILTAIIATFSMSINAQTQVCTFDMQIGDTTPAGQEGKRFYFGRYDDNNDNVFMSRFNVASDVTELRVNVGDDRLDKFVVGNTRWETPNVFNKYFVVTMDGKVGIKSPDPVFELEVNGVIKTKEIVVTDGGWADFVFRKDYRLRPLSEVETHIAQHSSLPEMPTESEVNANGVNLAEMNVKLLQKVEELTLYIIAQEKKMQLQETRISELENKIK